jgi:hypothetical protein
MVQRLGLELLDGMVPIARFIVPSAVVAEPFCLGRQGQVIIPFADVLPVHAALWFADGRLWAASADSMTPAIMGGKALPTDGWTEVPIPCVLRMGRVGVRPFLARQRAPQTVIPTPPTPFVTTTAPYPVQTPPLPAAFTRSQATTRRVRLVPAPVARVASLFAAEWQRAPLVAKLAVAVLPAIAILSFAGR